MKTKGFTIVLAFFLIYTQVWAQDDFGTNKGPLKYFLGISLIPAGNGDMYTFAEIEVLGKNQFAYQWITRQEFIAKASGMMSSKANPENKDLLTDYEIKTDNKYWDPIDNLWRLRFDGHPAIPEDHSGWFIPNPKYSINDTLVFKEGKVIDPKLYRQRDSLMQIYNTQRKMLAEIGIKKYSDYAYGDNVFKLIKSMQDSAWISKYVSTELPEAYRVALAGEDPQVLLKRGDKRGEQMVIHKPYNNETISVIRKDGLDQLLNGVKKEKTTPKKEE